MRLAIIILSGWRFLSAFLRKKSPLGVFSRADPELSSYPFWLKLKMLSHPMWGYLSEYFRHLLSFSAKTLFSKQTLFKWRAETVRPFCNAASGLSPGLFKNGYMVWWWGRALGPADTRVCVLADEGEKRRTRPASAETPMA